MPTLRRTHSTIEALEARIAPATIYAIDNTNQLIIFDSATPSATTTQAITGLAAPATEIIKGIDFRPATGQLYALGIDDFNGSTDEARIYTINLDTGVATQVGAAPFVTDLQKGNDYAFDFNPVVDLIRVASDRNDNIRVSPNDGTLVLNDTNISGGFENIIGVAYDRNFAGTTKTTLFGIDFDGSAVNDALVRIGGVDGNPSPNGGVTTLVGPLGVNVDDFKAGFDIETRTGTAYAALSVGGLTGLYRINLTSGAATFVGAIAGDPTLNGIAVAQDNLTISANGKTATYFDQDGDKVTVKTTQGTFSPQNFTLSPGLLGSQLRRLNIANDFAGQEFAGANITLTSTRNFDDGDGFANVGYIRAVGVDLGRVSVDGDLGQIDAGNNTTTTPGLAALTAQSMGVFGTATQLPAAPDLTSSILGKLGALTIKTDLDRANISVSGGAGGADGSIGKIVIGGDVVGGSSAAQLGAITSTGAMADVTVNGSIRGGSFGSSGKITSGTTMGKVTIGGSIFGGSASFAGVVQSIGNMGAVLVKGDIQGGTNDHTGMVHITEGRIASVTVNGSIIGGVTGNSNLLDSGMILDTGTKGIGPVKILGSLIGTDSDYSGSVYTNGKIQSVTINGSILGGTGDYSGAISSGGVGNVTIGVDARGDTGDWSGSVHTFTGGDIGNVTIKGSVVGGGNTLNGIISSRNLGAVKILGEVRADTAGGVRISAQGVADAISGIKSLSVTGSIRNALVLAGYNRSGDAVNADASIGAVSVGGNLIASSIIAGVDDGADDRFGTSDDAGIAEASDTIVSKIASITVKGYVAGTATGGDNFGFVADQISKIFIGGSNFLQFPLANDDLFAIRWKLGVNNDFNAFEVPA